MISQTFSSAQVDYEVHPQHRRDAKEALPASLVGVLQAYCSRAAFKKCHICSSSWLCADIPLLLLYDESCLECTLLLLETLVVASHLHLTAICSYVQLVCVACVLLLRPPQSSSHRSNFITPAVIGSLPKGLSQVEKAGLAQLGLSPAAARLQDLPVVSKATKQRLALRIVLHLAAKVV